jgi:serine/threonine-protein kinase
LAEPETSAADEFHDTERRPAGTKLGHFVLRGELGRGGMGVVYRADDETLGRTVALKLLPGGKGSDPQRRARFLREARSAASLVHANVATVYEVGDTDGELYIALELVVGQSLRTRMVARAQLAVDEVLSIAKGIARGLAAAHAKGIVHRDLKPENVMLDAEGEPKILDFGLAKLRSTHETPRHVLERQATDAALTEEGLTLGTPGYMSPEQLRGQDVDARSDVFSFGVMLFEMLAGIRPFQGESAMDLAIAITRDAPPRLSTLNGNVPVELEALVCTCLEKLPGQRFASARELLDALQAIGPDTRLVSPPRIDAALIPTRSETTLRVVRGPRSRAPLAIAIAALVVVALGAFLWRTRAHDLERKQAVAALEDGDAGKRRALALTDYPPPRSSNPEALAAYASGLQNMRDASITKASIDFAHAVTLDPTLAAAHLRLAKEAWWGGSKEHYAAASQLRATLDARDRALLPVAEAMTHDPIDWNEVAGRLRDVLARFPDDAETLADLGGALMRTAHVDEASDAEQRAIDIDPEFAGAMWRLSSLHIDTEDGEALNLADRCLAVSPTAASCLRNRAYVLQRRGECADYEVAARRMTTIEPGGPRPYWFLADALAVRGSPLESVREALETKSALDLTLDPASGAADKDANEMALGVLTGDFRRAAAAASDYDRLLASDTSEADHVWPVMTLISSLDEEGEHAKARKVAEAFALRVPAWTANDWTVRLYLLYAQHQAHLISDAALTQARAAIEEDAVAREVAIHAATTRLFIHAAFAGPDELADALAYVAQPSPHSDAEAFRGRVLLMAGQVDQALPLLQRAAARCAILPIDGGGWSWWRGYQPFAYVKSHLWLGRALEAKGDAAGACRAYGEVLARWKDAKPRSITADEARERARVLGCR